MVVFRGERAKNLSHVYICTKNTQKAFHFGRINFKLIKIAFKYWEGLLGPLSETCIFALISWAHWMALFTLGGLDKLIAPIKQSCVYHAASSGSLSSSSRFLGPSAYKRLDVY